MSGMTDAELLTHYRMIVPPDLYFELYADYERRNGEGSVAKDARRLTKFRIDPRYDWVTVSARWV